MKKKLSFFLIFSFFFSFGGCFLHKEDPQRKLLVGFWRLAKIKNGPQEQNLYSLNVVYVLQNNGTFIFRKDGEDIYQGTWRKTKKVIFLKHKNNKEEAGVLVDLTPESFSLFSEKDKSILTFTRMY